MADVTEKLKDLAQLFREGIITREELEQQKRELLSGGGAAAGARPSTVGSYRITGEIGVGGMGRVYQCPHPRQDLPTAGKICRRIANSP